MSATRERLEAMFRWLKDEGHLTPVGHRQLALILDEEGLPRGIADDVMVEGDYAGKVGSPGEHRTGGIRAWCHACAEWCYAGSPCGERQCCSVLA